MSCLGAWFYVTSQEADAFILAMDSDHSPVSSPSATDHLGINPYSFEPVDVHVESSNSGDDADSDTDEQEDRLANTDWLVHSTSTIKLTVLLYIYTIGVLVDNV